MPQMSNDAQSQKKFIPTAPCDSPIAEPFSVSISKNSHMPSQLDPSSNSVEIIPYGDRQRTLVRYTLAVEALKEALQLDRPGWEAFELQFDNFQDENLEFLHDAIEEKLNSSMNPVADSTIWTKCKGLGEQLVVAM